MVKYNINTKHEMFKTNKIDMKETKKCITESITFSCNTIYEPNVKRRYILRPFVSKKFQPLCAASTQIEETTLFPTDVTKKIKYQMLRRLIVNLPRMVVAIMVDIMPVVIKKKKLKRQVPQRRM